jgi:photosystem II stability/assembly factor-like uncharacterized protein
LTTTRAITSGFFAAALLAALGALGGAYPAEAGVNVWTTNGPGGGTIRALAIDPHTPTTLYAGVRGAPGGVFKSTDGGASWSAVNTGLPDPSATDLAVFSLAIDPQTPTTLYAGTWFGVFKSTDGGGTWVDTGLPRDADGTWSGVPG